MTPMEQVDLIEQAVQAGLQTDRNVKEALGRLQWGQILIQIRDAQMSMEMYLRAHWPKETDWDDRALYKATKELRGRLSA